MSFTTYAQSLKIGDTLPDLILPTVLNFSDNKLNLTSLRGKLIILDFWSHRCAPCIQAFPKLDSLQKVFKDKIQIVLVNKESKDSTIGFFAKRKKIKQPDIPMITGDTILLSLFPVSGYPYCVWINEFGVVKQFSSTQNVNAQNIKKVISGVKTVMNDPTVVVHGQLNNNKLTEYSSSLSFCNDSLNIGNGEKEIINGGRSFRISSNCSSVLDLYKKAYKEYDKFNVDTEYGTVLEIKDSAELYFLLGLDPENKLGKNIRFNYELILPAMKSAERYKLMQQDLSRYFGFSVEMEERNITSLVLKKDTYHNSLATRGGVPALRFRSEDFGVISDDTLFHLINQPFDILIRNLEAYTRYFFPFYDETGGVNSNIDIQIRKSSLVPLNVDMLKDDLKKVGLSLSFEERKSSVLVIRERPDR